MQYQFFQSLRSVIGISSATFLFVFLGAQPMARAGNGDLDRAFGHGGQLMTDFHHSTDIANAIAIQPDGKLVVVGTTYTHNDYSEEDFAVIRYNPDGTIDKTFGRNGKVTTDFPGLA